MTTNSRCMTPPPVHPSWSPGFQPRQDLHIAVTAVISHLISLIVTVPAAAMIPVSARMPVRPPVTSDAGLRGSEGLL